jgi:hypothetical protein
MNPRTKRLTLIRPDRRRPQLRFTPTAWAKLLFLRDLGPTEVGAFGITRPDDLLLVEEIQLVRQRCTETYVAFDDTAVADYIEHQSDLGRRLDQCARIWIHTHPGDSPHPSRVDEETFQRVFSPCDWAVMFILARGGQAFAELSWRHGGPASIRLGTKVDFRQPFASSDHVRWQDEYHRLVETHTEFDQRLMDFEDDWMSVSPLGQDFDLDVTENPMSRDRRPQREPPEPAPF